MRARTVVSAILGALLCCAAPAITAAAADDPYQWLEEIDGEKAIAWAKEQSAKTSADLGKGKDYKSLYDRTLQILDSKERIPTPSFRGEFIANFWQDKEHPRGIWRRTTLASYRTGQPQWETLIDVDAMVKADGVMWVWKGSNCLAPDDRLCMVSFSKGGGDASIYREFDIQKKAYVEGGFTLPEAKSRIAWKDENTLWLGTDFGPGSLTTSGYPRFVKLWKRGTPVAQARTVFEGETGDVASSGYTAVTPEGSYDFVVRTPAFFLEERYMLLGDRLVKIDTPEDSDLKAIFKDRMLLSLRSDWTIGGKTYRQGSLIAEKTDDFLRGKRRFDVVFEPSDRASLSDTAVTRDRLILETLDNVKSRLWSVSLSGDTWTKEEIPLPGLGSASVTASDDFRKEFFFAYNDFLTPSSLYLVDGGAPDKVKTAPSFFNADGIKVAQYEAASKDGTKIPYFVVTPKGFKADGNAPTLQYGYGGFEIPELPTYSGTVGASWLEKGGVYVLANIRGGGEFGPRWHQSALKENRIKVYEDFIAVADDVVARKITSPKHLGIMGGSQGGLLVSATMAMRPELFNAVVVAVPLADMRRYNKLLAGASWMEEYGNPDKPEEWAYIKTWSPYELVQKETTYPKPLIWTTTRDDRVHPGHARKLAAKMMGQGHDVYYYEVIEGGHGSGSVNTQKAQTSALEYAYLWKMLR